MNYDIEYDNYDKRLYLIEDVGSEPCTYECIAQVCWRDCVPCSYCEASKIVIPDRDKWNEWKIKYDKRKKIPCSKDYFKYFDEHRLETENFNENYFVIVNNEAVPIQTTIKF